MLLSKKIDVYKKKNKVILYVASGPGGWISAIWSFCIKSEKFELDISLHSHGLTSLGSLSLRATHVSPQFLTSDTEVGLLVHAPRSVLWHPSGERIVVVEAGRVFIFGVSWVSKVRRNAQEIQTTTISMKRANEIYCDQLEEEDQTEREEGNAVAASEMIGVKITVRNGSTHIGASAAALACTIFQDISGNPPGAGSNVVTPASSSKTAQLPPATTATVHTGRILIGTESGAVLSLSWGLPGDIEDSSYGIADTLDQSIHSIRTTSTLSHTQHGYENDSLYDEDEVHKRAHSYTTAGRLLATVICPAQQDFTQNDTTEARFGATSPRSNQSEENEEHRDLMRIWQANSYPLRTSEYNQTGPSGAFSNKDTLPEVVDIGDVGNFGTESPRASAMVEVDLSTDHSYTRTSESEVKGSSSHSTRSVSYWSASAVKEIVCCDRNKTLLIVYGDGSFSVNMLVAVVVQVPKFAALQATLLTTSATPKNTHSIGAPQAMSTTAVHTFVVHTSAKIHPVVLVAYPAQPVISATLDDSNVKGGYDSGKNSINKAVADVEPTPADNTHQPDIYQLGSSGAYRSTQYTTARDVQCTLDLTPSLFKKVTRMRKLVTGRAEEEISRVLSVQVVYDNTVVTASSNKSTPTGATNNSEPATVPNTTNSSMRVVALVQSRHLPALHTKSSSGEVLLGARQESLSVVVYDISLHSTANIAHLEGREIQCTCISSVCVDKNVTSAPSTTPVYEPSLQLIALPQQHNTHILIHHADNRVTCRSLDNLHSVVFVVNPLLHSLRPSLTTVSVCMNRVLLTSWDSNSHAGKASEHNVHKSVHSIHTAKAIHTTATHSTQTETTSTQPQHAYVTGKHAPPSLAHINTGDSRIVILPILTSVTCKGLQSQNKLMYVDLSEGALHTVDTHASQHTPMPSAGESRARSDTQDCITTHNTTAMAKANISINSNASVTNANALDANNIYNAPLVTTQLKLPRRLLSDVQHYRSLCSISNPFQSRKLFRNVQEGLLIASSHQCREERFNPVLYYKHGVSSHSDSGTYHDTSRTTTEYLAMIAGGSSVPYKHSTTTQASTTISTTHTRNNTTSTYTAANAPSRKYTPLLWVYNTTTNRWRSTYLIAGNQESSACLVKDIPSMHSLRKDANIHLYNTAKDNIKAASTNNKLAMSSASVDSVTPTVVNPTLRSGSVDSHHSAELTTLSPGKSNKRRNSDNSVTLTAGRTNSDPPGSPPKNATKGFNVRSLFSFSSTTSRNSADGTDAVYMYKPSTSVPINNRSHMAGSASSILSIAWYNVHSIVLLTLRRSTYCIEIISREASKSSMSTGKLQPLVHKIIMLPPGYSPNSLECIVVQSEHGGGVGRGTGDGNVHNLHTPHASDKGVLSPSLHTHTIDEGNESETDSSSVDSDIEDTELVPEHNNNNSVFALQPPTPPSVQSSTKGAIKPAVNKAANATRASVADGLSGCVVVVSDNTTLLCYHIQAQGTYITTTASSKNNSTKTGDNKNIATAAKTLQVNDYLVTELWDLNLTSLVVNDARATAVSTSHATGDLPVPGVQFPVKDVKVFIQNTPITDAQVDGYHRMSLCFHHPNQSVVPVFPLVSLHLLDNAGNVFTVDAENGECTFLSNNVNNISIIGTSDVCVNNIVRHASATEGGHSTLLSTVIGSPLLLHTTSDPAGDAQRNLLYIFDKTSLIQYIRPAALHIQRNLVHFAPQLRVPVNILVKPNVDKNDVHSFSDTDLQRRHKGAYTVQTGHISVQLSHTNSDNTLLHTKNGLLVSMGTKVVNILDYMRSRESGFLTGNKNNATEESDMLEFVPYLCAAFGHCLHGEVDIHGSRLAQLHLYSAASASADGNKQLQPSVLQTVSAQLLHKMRSSSRYTALLIAYIEYSVMQYTLQPAFSYKHPQYAALTEFLYKHDPCLLGEVLSRLGRKLEPVVSHQLFPVQVYGMQDASMAPHTTSVLRLYESFLQCQHNHHAARVLSLACECIGGSESHITTTASLILALELLHYSIKYTSLRNVVECVDFCSRLECMLVMHSRNIFGVSGSTNSTTNIGVNNATTSGASSASTTPHSPRTLDNSYTSTVKSKALSLIQNHRDLVYRQTRHAMQAMESKKANEETDTVFTPTAAASPALPFYLGMGVGWILTKAVNSLIPETVNSGNNSQVPPRITNGTGATVNSSSVRNNGLSVNIDTTHLAHIPSATYSADDYLRQCMIPSVSNGRTLNADTSVYSYKVIDLLEKQYGAVAVSQMLSRTHLTPAVHHGGRSVSTDACTNQSHGNNDNIGAAALPASGVPSAATNVPSGIVNAHVGDQSPTALLLVHTLSDYFSASTHYVNAAVLLVALLQHTTTVQLLHHYLMSMHSSIHTTSSDVGATSKEKVRRILYVYRLNKVLSRTSITHSGGMNTSQHSSENIAKMLTQRVSAQYLRRVVEADVIHYHATHHSQTNHNHTANAVNKVNIVSETPRVAATPGGPPAPGSLVEAASPHTAHVPPAMHNQDRHAGYFELTEELLLQNKDASGKSSGKQDAGERHLNLLAILKSLAVGLLLVGDSVAAGLLLQTILPYIKHIDSGLYSVVSVLPPVHNAVSIGNDTMRHYRDISESECDRQTWNLSSEQLDKLFLALV